MPKESIRLRAQDLRAIYLLVGECCELGADPLVWRQHMLTRLNNIFGAVASVNIEATFDANAPGIGAKVDMAMTLDPLTPRERETLTACMREMPLEANPLGMTLLVGCPPDGTMSAVRRERIGDAEWRRCQFMTDYFAPLDWDDMVVAIAKQPTSFRCYNFSRERSDIPFPLRAARMLDLFVQELTHLPATRLAPMSEQSLLDLPARLRDVLMALAEGDSEKQIAVRLGITRSTVHEYVRRLFERYGVSSRGQLLIRAARQVHAYQLVAGDRAENCWLFQSASA